MNTSTYQAVTDDRGLVTIVRTDADGKTFAIPTDPANSDYQAYLATLAANPAPTA